ncbi:TIGR04255 family protein [Sulfitobacter sp. M21595]|uniref:TIGR04255 family protein n=1 Tax=Sulfitobacter sp. M21595 TaxID=3368574 RepID=UPI0037476230
MKLLPKVLEREPLVDALFEVRLVEAAPLAEILPGFLFQTGGAKPTVTRLPAAELPRDLRASDPNLHFAPIVRIEMEHFVISAGDRNVIINCKMPYPKWASFKAEILKIVGRIADIEVAGNVERYSLKYVNLIQAPTLAEQVAKINMSINIGDVELVDSHANIQVHKHENGILHILSAVVGAQGQIADGRVVFGTVVDIDSIRNIDAIDFRTFASDLEPGLVELREANKKKFFSCLTDETIQEMGPVYD